MRNPSLFLSHSTSIIHAAVILCAFALLTSCGGGKRESDIRPQITNVTGELSDYFTVVDGSYKLFSDGEKGVIKGMLDYQVKVQLNRTDDSFDFDAVDLESRGYFSLVCDLLDEQGVPMVTADRSGWRTQGVNSEDAAFASLKPGETGWAIFSFLGDIETMDKVKSFQVGSTANMEQAHAAKSISSNEDTSSSMETEEDSPSSSIDCDQFIKEYSAFVESYVKLLAKYKKDPTDMTIVSEYTEAAQKANQMQTHAGDCTDPKYVSELLKLNNKLAQAAL